VASLYGRVSKETYDEIEYVYNEFQAEAITEDVALKKLADVIAKDKLYTGSPEYLANWIITVARELVYAPYGVACSDGQIRLEYRIVGSMIAEEVAVRTRQPHEGCPDGLHAAKVWNLCDLEKLEAKEKEALTASAPKA